MPSRALASRCPEARSKVVIARDPLMHDSANSLDSTRLLKTLDRAMQSFYGCDSPIEAWKQVVRPGEVVGLKVNCLAGRGASTSVALVEAICERLQQAGIPQKNIVIWDRLNSDLESAGFRVGSRKDRIRCLGNDTAGYENELAIYGSAGSLLSKTLTRICDAVINLPVLKDHGIVGVTMALKNLFGAIHNPNKYHINAGDPYVADVNMLPPIRQKVRLHHLRRHHARSTKAGLRTCRNGSWPYNGLLVARDPVALDYTGWQIIERKRAEKGMKPLQRTAARAGLHRHRRGRAAPARHQRSAADRRGGGVTPWIAGAFCPDRWRCPACAPARAAESDARFTVEARFYEKLPYKKIKCKLCPRECVIDDRERGYCGVRENRGGTYYTLVHSRVVRRARRSHREEAVLPLPARHDGLLDGHGGLQRQLQDVPELGDLAGPAGAGAQPPTCRPRTWPTLARQYRCPSIAYTYSEPVVFYEYVLDAAEAGRAAGVKSVVVTRRLHPAGAAQEVVPARGRHQDRPQGLLREVLQGGGERRAEAGARRAGDHPQAGHVERDRLPGDPHAERFRRRSSEALARWVKAELGPDVPLHFSRFHPEYLLKNLPPTPLADAGARQGHLRRRGSALRLHRQRSRPSGREHLLPEVPPRGGGARRLHRASACTSTRASAGICQQAIPGIWEE